MPGERPTDGAAEHAHRAELRVPAAEELARSLAADMTRRAQRHERPDDVAPFDELLTTLCRYIREHSPPDS